MDFRTFEVGDWVHLESISDDGAVAHGHVTLPDEKETYSPVTTLPPVKVVTGEIIDTFCGYWLVDSEVLGKLHIKKSVGHYYSKTHQRSLKIFDWAGFEQSLQDNDSPMPFIGYIGYFTPIAFHEILEFMYGVEEESLIINYKTNTYGDFERCDHYLVHRRDNDFEYVPYGYYTMKKAGVVKSATKR